jgi:hypothetical protein
MEALGPSDSGRVPRVARSGDRDRRLEDAVDIVMLVGVIALFALALTMVALA